jgi:hypothetical protein
MVGTYAYSLDGQRYIGSFETREQALTVALDAAKQRENPPETVFVGRSIPVNAKASGHARMIISNMAARAREEAGDAGDDYLQQVSKPQIEELDQALENTVLGWLTKHHMLPKFFRVESISEYAVPIVPRTATSGGNNEVHDLGVSDAADPALI